MTRQASAWVKVVGYSTLVLGAFVSLVPFVWMLIASTHTTSALFTTPPPLLPGGEVVTNLIRLQESTNFARVMANSLVIAVIYTVFSALVSAMCGFALAKYRFRGRNVLFVFIMATMMIPMQVLLVPLFQIMASLGWINTFQAVILPFLASAFGIFLMRQSFLNFPTEIIEASRIDGCSEMRIFFFIVLPVAKPALGALVIYTFMSQWNAFLWPLLMMSEEKMYTLPVALSTMVGLTRVDYSGLMLGSLLTTIPMLLIFLIFQKQFVAGLLGGAVKG